MNEIEKKFEEKAITQMKALASAIQQKKELEAQEKNLKAELKVLMDEYGIKNIKTPVLTITNIAASETETVDLEAFRKNEPEEYADLLKDYPKVTKRASYLKFDLPRTPRG